jgi:hypothetical protein
MIRASALYIVIVISLVIAVICSFLLMAAYIYQEQYAVKTRFDRLSNNLSSGINILLATKDSSYRQGKLFNLYEGDQDSVLLRTMTWGIYDLGIAEAFKGRDMLFKVFSTAYCIDSTKWAAVYLADEDRPLSLSGNTELVGNAYLPKAGLKPAYVDNQAYQGDKRLIIGKQYDSERKLPALNKNILQLLERLFSSGPSHMTKKLLTDSLNRSFRDSSLKIRLGTNALAISNTRLSGNIILYADTLLTIDSSAVLNNVLVFAKAILIKKGFHGNCQLFARDSISIGANCTFTYPSCLGILRIKTPMVGHPAQINLGENSSFTGTIFTYEKELSGIPSVINLAKGVQVNGQIYAQNSLSTKDKVTINGSVFVNRFSYQSAFTRYENYLINLKINAPALSRYYLTSGLLPVASTDKKILQWLETN